jgi:hypothetical protein
LAKCSSEWQDLNLRSPSPEARYQAAPPISDHIGRGGLPALRSRLSLGRPGAQPIRALAPNGGAEAWVLRSPLTRDDLDPRCYGFVFPRALREVSDQAPRSLNYLISLGSGERFELPTNGL